MSFPNALGRAAGVAALLAFAAPAHATGTTEFFTLAGTESSMFDGCYGTMGSYDSPLHSISYENFLPCDARAPDCNWSSAYKVDCNNMFRNQCCTRGSGVGSYFTSSTPTTIAAADVHPEAVGNVCVCVDGTGNSNCITLGWHWNDLTVDDFEGAEFKYVRFETGGCSAAEQYSFGTASLAAAKPFTLVTSAISASAPHVLLKNRRSELVFQHDGNLVLYSLDSSGNRGAAAWATATDNRGVELDWNQGFLGVVDATNTLIWFEDMGDTFELTGQCNLIGLKNGWEDYLAFPANESPCAAVSAGTNNADAY